MLTPSAAVREAAALKSSDAVPCVLRAYGEADDALRLTVILAKYLGGAMDGVAELVDRCLDPRAPSVQRLETLAELLSLARSLPAARVAALIDPDALEPTKPSTWADPRSAALRRTFLDIVLRSHGWVLVRQSPSAALSQRLAEGAVDASDSETTPDAGSMFAPECRAAVRWLLGAGHVTARDLDHIVSTVIAFNEHVLRLTYDALPGRVRRTARSLCVRRAPATLNGTFGALPWSGPVGIDRADVDVLRACGFLLSDEEAHPMDVRMPRRVREMISLQAGVDAASVRSMHARWASAPNFENRTSEEQMEMHHHAVQARDVNRAKATARFYGTDLLDLATNLSREDGEYELAAGLFKHVRDAFDSSDPYVWEYWAYNLARWDFECDPFRHQEEIQHGYEKACALSPQNPLYRGRLLGYRARLGLDVRTEFDRYMNAYLTRFADETDAISKFAEVVLDGSHHSGGKDATKLLLEKWRPVLERVAPRVILKHGA